MKKQIRNLSYITTLLLLVCSTNSYAQSWKSKRYELYYGLGAINFNGDIGATAGADVWVKLFETVSPTLNTGLRYKFDDRHAATGSIFLGQLYAKDHAKGGYPTRAMAFNSFFTELGGRYEFSIIQEKRKRTVYRQFGESSIKNFNLPTHIFVGFGGTFNTGTFEQDAGRNIVKEKFTNFAPVLMYGIGAKYKITRKSYIGVELNVRLAINDKIDNAWKSPETGSTFGSWFDAYQTLTVNYVQQIRSNRNGTPNFRRRGSSAKISRKPGSRSRRR